MYRGRWAGRREREADGSARSPTQAEPPAVQPSALQRELLSLVSPLQPTLGVETTADGVGMHRRHQPL